MCVHECACMNALIILVISRQATVWFITERCRLLAMSHMYPGNLNVATNDTSDRVKLRRVRFIHTKKETV